MKTILLWPDTHLPFQHKKVVDKLLTFTQEIQPDEVLFLGDLYDFKSISRWTKTRKEERGELLQAEADAGWYFLDDFRSVYSGPARILTGNHEERLENYLELYAPGLFGMTGLTLGNMFHFDEFNIEISAPGKAYKVAPGVKAIHGKALSKHSTQSAFKELQRHGTSIVQGHSHRLGIMYQTLGDTTQFAAECGWLGDIRKMDYLDFEGVSNWQMGFGILTVDDSVKKKKQLVTPELVLVNDDSSFVFRGKRY